MQCDLIQHALDPILKHLKGPHNLSTLLRNLENKSMCCHNVKWTWINRPKLVDIFVCKTTQFFIFLYEMKRSGGRKKHICCPILHFTVKVMFDTQIVDICACASHWYDSQFYLPILLCVPKHGSCTGEDSVSEPTQSNWVHKKKALSYTLCTESHINQLSSSESLHSQTFISSACNVMWNFNCSLKHVSLPCLSPDPQFCFPYFSWPDSGTKSQ